MDLPQASPPQEALPKRSDVDLPQEASPKHTEQNMDLPQEVPPPQEASLKQVLGENLPLIASPKAKDGLHGQLEDRDLPPGTALEQVEEDVDPPLIDEDGIQRLLEDMSSLQEADYFFVDDFNQI